MTLCIPVEQGVTQAADTQRRRGSSPRMLLKLTSGTLSNGISGLYILHSPVRGTAGGATTDAASDIQFRDDAFISGAI